MSLGLELILSTTLATAPPACSWAHPGANPYRGDPVRALADFGLPAATQARLRALMRAHRPTDNATITRDDIVGEHATYTDLREMHSGHGRVCHGAVDRSAWSAKRRERALVYCADDACVIVPVICNNVSLVSRAPEHVARRDDAPIDIEPAAGPPHAEPPSASPDDHPLDGSPMPGGGSAPGRPDADAGVDIDSSLGAGQTPVVPPGVGDALPIGGGPPCCDIGPVVPIGPGTPPSPGGPQGPAMPPIIAPVPESPAWLLLSAGLLGLCHWRRRTTPRGGDTHASRGV